MFKVPDGSDEEKEEIQPESSNPSESKETELATPIAGNAGVVRNEEFRKDFPVQDIPPQASGLEELQRELEGVDESKLFKMLQREDPKDEHADDTSMSEDEELEFVEENKSKTLLKEDETEQETEKDAKGQEKRNKDKLNIEEELEALKAEKVSGMVDAISKNGQFHSHLLYVTNWQANAISNNTASVKRMIEFFHGENKPRFIIHLVQSWGFYKSTKLMHESHFEKGMSIGIKHNTPPFRTYKEMNKTHSRMCHFMTEVILPLAERTNALIICNAVADECILTETLINVLRMNASRWNGGPMPFTVIKILNQVECLYKKRTRQKQKDGPLFYMKDFEENSTNKNRDYADWMGFMEQSKGWKRRHESLSSHFEELKKNKGGQNNQKKWWKGHDLDWSLGNLIVVEGLDKGENSKYEKNQGPANLLLTRILDNYGHIPTLAIKTGATPRYRMGFNPNAIDLMGYPYLVNRVNSETHVLCLDVRKRNPKYERNPDEITLDDTLEPNFDRSKLDWSEVDMSEDDTSEIEMPRSDNADDVDYDKNYEIREETMKMIFPRHDSYHETLDCCALSYLGRLMKKKEEQQRKEERKAEKQNQKNCENDTDGKRKITGIDQRASQRFVLRKEKRKENNGRESTLKRMSSAFNTKVLGNEEKEEEEKEKQLSLKALVEEKRKEGDQREHSYRKERCLHYAYQFVDHFQKENSKKRNSKEQKGKKQFDEKLAHRMTTNIQQLLKSDLFHCKSIWESEKELDKYIDENILFKYHRPHSIVPFEGLKLLECAWEYVDKTSTDADGYRKLSIVLFLTQLILGVLITVETALALRYEKGGATDNVYQWLYKDVTLVTTLVLTAVVSIDSLLTPKLMWRQLRLASVELESLIWKYRAGVGSFDPGLDTLRDAEDNFDIAFTKWKENLHNTLNNVGGTMIPQNIKSPSTSALPSFFARGNRNWTSEEEADKDCDNHYSYVLSKHYLNWRVQQLLEIYQERLPKRVWSQQKWQLIMIILGIGIAFITETEIDFRPELILILTAITGALSSWSGFVDLQGDAQLYPPAINAIRNKTMEWEKRSKHQQQDLELFEDLVLTIESIATNVVESWSNSLSERNAQQNNFDVTKGGKADKSKSKPVQDLESIA